MVLIALGATLVTTSRFRDTAALRCALVIHLFVYMSLYLIFIFAVCDAAMRGPQAGLGFVQVLDFGLSAALMIFVVRLSIASITGGEDAPAR